MFFKNDDREKGAAQLPLLPLRDIIVFPHMVVPLFVGREKSINALEQAMNARQGDRPLRAEEGQDQRSRRPTTSSPSAPSVRSSSSCACPTARSRCWSRASGARASASSSSQPRSSSSSRSRSSLEPNEKSVEIEALMRSVHQTFENYVKLNKRIPPEMLISVQTIDDPARLADTIVAALSLKLARQAGRSSRPSRRPSGSRSSSS